MQRSNFTYFLIFNAPSSTTNKTSHVNQPGDDKNVRIYKNFYQIKKM